MLLAAASSTNGIFIKENIHANNHQPVLAMPATFIPLPARHMLLLQTSLTRFTALLPPLRFTQRPQSLTLWPLPEQVTPLAKHHLCR